MLHRLLLTTLVFPFYLMAGQLQAMEPDKDEWGGWFKALPSFKAPPLTHS